jgi:hypothetical protein
LLKKCFPALNLPVSLLASGLVVLATNLVLPWLHRSVLETGTADYWEKANQWCWFAVLPLLQLLANTLVFF